MCAMATPMDMTSSNLRAHDDSCAFPSWPRRSSLSDSDADARESRATSFISDDDLLFLSDPFEDDARSVGSASSQSSSPAASFVSPRHAAAQLERERERQLAQQQQYVRQVMADKEQRRRQQQQTARRQSQQQMQQGADRRQHRSPKKSPPRSKLGAMTPITEAVFE